MYPHTIGFQVQSRPLCAQPPRFWQSIQRLWWATLLLPACVGGASPSDLDPTFNAGSTINDSVFACAVQADGKVVIVGSFKTVHASFRSGLARLNVDGSTDESFPGALSGGYASAYDCITLPDGRILVGGNFTQINGVMRGHLARLNTNGTVDESFTTQIAGGTVTSVSKLARQSDGRIIIAGGFTSVFGVPRAGLARLHSDGSLDETFLNGLSGADGQTVAAILVQPDGQLVVAGHFETFNGVARPYLARLNQDGSLDETFLSSMAGPDFPARALALRPDGKLIVGGFFRAFNGLNQPGITRLNLDGSVDESFSSAASALHGGPNQIIIGPDEKILIGGCLRWAETLNAEGIVRLNANGTRDDSFLGSQPAWDDVGVRTMRLLSDGTILAGGGSSVSVMPAYFMKLTPEGTTDPHFENGPAGPNDEVKSLALQPDGKLIIGGRFGRMGNTAQRGIARLHANGSWDTSYGFQLAGTDRDVFAVALDQQARCLVAGEFSLINGVPRQGLARLNPDGSVDETFKNVLVGPYGYAYALALQSDGKAIVGGAYRSIDGVAQTNLARLNDDGSIDTSFAPRIGVGSVNGVYTMALQADGKVIIGGYFNSVGGLPRKNLARLHPGGSVDTTFLNGLAGLSATPWSIAVQPDGKVLVGGWFETVNGTTRYGFARLNSDGSVDPSFASICQTYSAAWAITVQNDGKILIGGYLTINGRPYYLVRLNANGTLDETFSVPEAQPNHEVLALAIQPDTRILAAGDFTIFGPTPCDRVVRLMGSFAAPAIVSQPKSQTAETGAAADFRVKATGFPPVTYQWYFNDTNLLMGCTNAALHLADVSLSNVGTYHVVVANAGAAVTSTPVILSAIAPVERRTVPGLTVMGTVAGVVEIQSTATLESGGIWSPLATATLTTPPDWWFDLADPLPAPRFYRTLVISGGRIPPLLGLHMIPALTLTGNIGNQIQVEGINRYGPTDAWFPLATVTLTNTAQLYFDTNAVGQPLRLYRFTTIP
jgi:uncharacterized delta-60 repeat protein